MDVKQSLKKLMEDINNMTDEEFKDTFLAKPPKVDWTTEDNINICLEEAEDWDNPCKGCFFAEPDRLVDGKCNQPEYGKVQTCFCNQGCPPLNWIRHSEAMDKFKITS